MKWKRIHYVAALSGIVFSFFLYQLFRPSFTNTEKKYLYIRDNLTLHELKEELKKNFQLKGKGFELAAKILRFKKPKSGRYIIKDGESAWSVVRKLRQGRQAVVRITIVKERTKELFAGKIGTGKRFDFMFDSLQMIQYLNNPEEVKKYGVDTGNVMAIIMPDTYFQVWNSTPEKLMQQFYNRFKKYWNAERTKKAQARGLTPLQTVILASIVEEETNLKKDKYLIASVYLNRLKKGMKLEADPTVKFVTRNFQLGRILYSHLKIPSPYNTYLNTGLPPGPICTPSEESIEAVLDAPETDYLFFVASYKFDGTSIFTSNLKDHTYYAGLLHQELDRRADSIRKLKETNMQRVP
ncbi:MAG: endolytic transglycosylase MltG [Chitinophagaceae bacterium]|nr:endolytic transglycosylase MltG [Chitinophagaceae bacterium]